MAKVIKTCDIDDYHYLWQKKKTVLGGGCFDLFHYGHLKFLQSAKKQGEYLIILLESDQFIKEKKRKIPVHNQKQRAEILSAISYVDLIILLPYLKTKAEYFQLVKKINPQIIAVTAQDKALADKKEQAKKIKAQIKVVTPLIKKFSSSQIIQYESIFSD